MNQQTISKKIWSLVFLCILGIGIIVSISVWTMNVLSQKTSDLYNHPFTVSNAVLNVKVGMLSIHRDMKDISTATSKDELKNKMDKVNKHEQNVLKNFEIIEKRYLGDLQDVLTPKKMFIDWKVIRDEVIELSMNNEKEKAKLITKNKGADHVMKLQNAVEKLVDFATNKGAEFYANTQSFKMEKLRVFGLFTFIVCSGIIFLSVIYIKGINKALLEKRVGLQIQSKNANENVYKLYEIGNNLVSSANEQTMLLSSTVEAMTELQEGATRSSERSNSATKIVGENQKVAGKGAKNLGDLVSAIQNIQNANGQVIETVQKSHEDIGGIVKMIQEISVKTQIINEIVFQTKLLSFNASVEAARAGEHGKGFAVVAEEIGNLASLSGQAASEINTMLESRTHEISELVSNSTETIQSKISTARSKIMNGLDLAKECKVNFDLVADNAQKASSMINEVDQNTKEQTDAIKMVLGDIDRLHRLSSEYKQTSKNTQKMGTELVQGQEKLDQIVIDLSSMIEKKVA